LASNTFQLEILLQAIFLKENVASFLAYPVGEMNGGQI
jgi:hypothetical protein